MTKTKRSKVANSKKKVKKNVQQQIKDTVKPDEKINLEFIIVTPRPKATNHRLLHTSGSNRIVIFSRDDLNKIKDVLETSGALEIGVNITD